MRTAAALILIIIAGCSPEEGYGTGTQGAPVEVGLELFAGGFASPVQVLSAPGDRGRMFVVEQPGVIRIIRNGDVLPEPFLDISARVRYGGEAGLLSLAFPPGGTEGADHFYIDYTRVEDGATVVARCRIDPEDPDRALEGSLEEVLSVPQPHGNHNGGMTAFGPDGYLYIALGDGGGSGDPGGNGQDPSNLLGSILRIDVESSRKPYGVPADNPFVGREGYREEIWAWGLRNPWRFSFDRRTGDLFIADVGQSLWEEIDFQPAGDPGGRNYGWNRMEGSHCYEADTCDMSGMTAPVHEYSHEEGCSVTGGYVYRGIVSTGLFGVYLFGDYCSGRIWGLSRSSGGWSATELADTGLRIVSFGESAAGEVYVVDLGGDIYRIVERDLPGVP